MDLLKERYFKRFAPHAFSIALCATALAASAQTGLEVDGEIIADAAGTNSEVLVTPYVLDFTVDSPIGNCARREVDNTELLARCADSDGCTFRITLNSTNILNASAPTTLIVRSDGTNWAVPAEFPASDPPITGVNNDNSRDTVGIFRGCWFFDDSSTGPSTSFQFANCNNDEMLFGPGPVTCSLRIDD